MAYVLQQFRATDDATFTNVYLDDLERRRRLGSRGGRVFHAIGAEHEITVLIEFDSAANAHQFAQSIELQEAVTCATSDVVPQKITVLEEQLRSEA
ncbi:MAG: DUF1330 domain-containing protein [Actinobacteria bacterium]|nr:DUF1330 domain-containing protein [Actinomycetota bacterium]